MAPLGTITNKPEHDAAVAKAEAGTPSVLYVTAPAMPVNRAFAPEYEAVAARHPDVHFYVMEFSNEISPMIKFGPWQTPILILIKGGRCRTILGGDVEKLEAGVMQDLESSLN